MKTQLCVPLSAYLSFVVVLAKLSVRCDEANKNDPSTISILLGIVVVCRTARPSRLRN